ncbi:hypothetical protein [Sphingomonas sp.]|uniref:hypothetical protein n=1 Tax=Sphingomonas sp. TaxID=28214 RepID=UPI00257D3BF0|nr:hypothetical protein [Sphingomonas sp.]
MVLRQFRLAVLGALLALAALCGSTALTTWHDTSFLSDTAVEASLGHAHERSVPDPDNSVHLAAHAAGHWLRAEPQADRLIALAPATRPFVVDVAPALTGTEPGSLLRPPKA